METLLTVFKFIYFIPMVLFVVLAVIQQKARDIENGEIQIVIIGMLPIINIAGFFAVLYQLFIIHTDKDKCVGKDHENPINPNNFLGKILLKIL